jgi:hypothetical protein
MVERSRPSMLETLPPVTRLMMLLTVFGPEKVADSPVLILKLLKLWNRLPPVCWPRSAVTWKSGPGRERAGPRLPSVLISALAWWAMSRPAKVASRCS